MTRDNVGTDPGKPIAAVIIDAIRSGRDLYVYDVYIVGPHALERARAVLLEKLSACSDPEQAASLTGIIRELEEAALP